jgi:hypothetical protein
LYGNSRETCYDVTVKEEVILGRVKYVIIRIEGEVVDLANVYVPNHETTSVVFWKEMLEKLPNIPNWCMKGDFNIIESCNDRCGGSSYIIHGQKLADWEKLCVRFRLEDAWTIQDFSKDPRLLMYSRSDRRILGATLSRIDRIYIRCWWYDQDYFKYLFYRSCASDSSTSKWNNKKPLECKDP